MITITDFDLATFLFCQGFRPDDMAPLTNKKATFYFRPLEEIERLEKMFWAGEALVEPRHYTEARKTLKAQFENLITNSQKNDTKRNPHFPYLRN